MNKQLLKKIAWAGAAIVATKILEHVGDYVGERLIKKLKDNGKEN